MEPGRRGQEADRERGEGRSEGLGVATRSGAGLAEAEEGQATTWARRGEVRR